MVKNLIKKDYYRYMFLIGAIWNWIVGLIFILVSPFAVTLFPLFEMAVPPSLIFYHAFFGFVVVFGIGYYLVSRDINNNHAVVILGVFGKFFVFVLFVIYFILGDYNFAPVLFVIVDFIFGCLFLEFLINFKKI
jgi:hypothetical protein